MHDRPDHSTYGCTKCWPESADLAWKARPSLKHETELIDESHFHLMILRCPECRQGFLSVFMESVDWVDGDDPQYWSVIPVDAAEIAKLTNVPITNRELAALAPDRRSLFRASPKGQPQSNRWAAGVVLVSHD